MLLSNKSPLDDEYLDKLNVPIFYKKWYLDLCYGSDWDYFYHENSNGSYGILPYKITYMNDKKCIGMPLMTQYLGPYVRVCDGLSVKKRYSVEDRLLSELCKDIQKLDLDFYGQRWHFESNNWLPFYYDRYNCNMRYSHKLELKNSSYEMVYHNYTTQVRNKLKKKSFSIVENDVDFSAMYAVLSYSLKKYNKIPSYTEKQFSEYMSCLYEHNGVISYSAYDKGILLAVAVFLYDSDNMYYYLAGEDSKCKSYNAPTILIDEAIKYALHKGFNLDFCGSMLAPLANFYEGFGAKRNSVLVVYKDAMDSLTEVERRKLIFSF